MPQFNDGAYGDVSVPMPLVYGLIRDDDEAQNADKTKRQTNAQLLAATLGYASKSDSTTMSGNATLDDEDNAQQFMDPNGANRDVTLPAEGSANHVFMIANTGSTYALTVKDDGGSTIATISAGDNALFWSDGAAWYTLSGGGGGGGEVNTASNVGTAGVGVFKQKSVYDLEFKKINAGSSKVTIADDTGNDEVDIDVAPGQIAIGDLSGAPTGDVVGNSDAQTLTNKTIDPSANTIDGDKLDVTYTPSNYTPDASPAEADDVDDLAAHLKGVDTAIGAASGEANTASNVGTAGVGVFKQKAGDDLEFKKINAGSSKVTIADDTGNDEVDIDVAPGQIAIGDLSGAPTGDVVGTSDAQALTNKTIDGDLNTISNLAHGAEVDNPSSGVHGVTGDVVGNSDAQTLTNKTIDPSANTIDGDKLDVTFTPSNYTPDAAPAEADDVDDLTAHLKGIDTAIGAGGGGGEANTASNVGTGGVGVFKQKAGVDLEFKKINAGSSKVTIADDTGNDEVDIDVDPSAIAIGDLSGAPTGDVVGSSDAQTLTNKTIDPSANTIDGDKLDVTFTPSNYTPDAAPAEADDVDDLAAHLKGVDTAVGAKLPLAGGTMTGDLVGGGNSLHGFEGEINAQTGTTYTTQDSDNGKIITLNNASAITVTIHQGAAAGFNCLLIQKGAGQVTVAAGGTGNIRNRQSHTKISGQYGVTSIFVESNAGTAPEAYLMGDTAA